MEASTTASIQRTQLEDRLVLLMNKHCHIILDKSKHVDPIDFEGKLTS